MINPKLTPFIDRDSVDMKNNYDNFLKLIKKVFK
jgi:hypothetical protein